MTPREMATAFPEATRRRYVRLTTYQSGKSSKFYEVLIAETGGDESVGIPSDYTVLFRWGRIGADGETQVQVFANYVDAMNAFDSKVKSKKAKGYVTQWYKPNGRDTDDERSVEEDAAPTKKHFEPSKSDEKYDNLQQQRKDEAPW